MNLVSAATPSALCPQPLALGWLAPVRPGLAPTGLPPCERGLNAWLKRAIDLLGALVGLAVGLPLMVLFGWLIRRESPGPVLFSQVRVGRGGQLFRMYKLRTMQPGADKSDHLIGSTQGDDPRLLRVGRWMRRWNVDEVPQFWNVLCGQMSLVGPRPERPLQSQRLEQSLPHYQERYAVKPGMTGWAQINGFRGPTSLSQRLHCDLFYLQHWSFQLDVQILVRTLWLRDESFGSSH